MDQVELAVKYFSCTGIYPIEEFRFAPSETYEVAITEPIASPPPPGPSTEPDVSPLPSTVQETNAVQLTSTTQQILPSEENTPIRPKKKPDNIATVEGTAVE